MRVTKDQPRPVGSGTDEAVRFHASRYGPLPHRQYEQPSSMRGIDMLKVRQTDSVPRGHMIYSYAKNARRAVFETEQCAQY
jgi:hypothetical protein